MTNLYSVEGKVVGKIELPKVFKTQYRPDLIQRAVVSIQSKRMQPHGVSLNAGLETAAEYYGRRRDVYRMTINRGMSRLPREKTGGGGLGKVRRVPQSVGGRSAHPPKVEKIHAKEMNKKEYAFALKSAISALTKKDLTKKRGHLISKLEELPIVVEDGFEAMSKTKEIISVLEALGISEDISRGREKKVRGGKGTMRGRKYVKKKSALIVVKDDGSNLLLRGAKNIPGVDVTSISTLDVELLAPGTHPGRLSVWTKGAVEDIERALFSEKAKKVQKVKKKSSEETEKKKEKKVN